MFACYLMQRRAIDRKEEGIQERVPSGTSDAVQKEQNSLRLLASRALEALAQTPAGHYGRPTRGKAPGFGSSLLKCFLILLPSLCFA